MNKGTNKQQQPDSSIHDTSAHCPRVYQVSVPEKSVMKNFNVWKLERKKNEEIKGRISSSRLILVYTIHLPTVHVCTKFQSSRPQFLWKVTKKISILKIGEKEKWRNKGMNKQQQPDSGTQYICPLSTCVLSFNLLGLTVPEKSVTKNSNVWKVNWTWEIP